MPAPNLAFHLTDRCDLNCKHCLRDPGKQPRDLDPSVVERVLDQGRAAYGASHAALTGGEPLLYPPLERVLDAISTRGMTWNVVTNATRARRLVSLLSQAPARREGLRAVDVSVDGATEATHDRIRGVGSYRQTFEGIASLLAADIPIVLQMTVNAYNRHELRDFAFGAARLGAIRASFSWMQPTGTHLDDALALSPLEWRRVRQEIEDLADALKMPLSMPEGHYQSGAFHVCEPFRSGTLHTDVDGFLNLCCQHSGVPSVGSAADRIADLSSVPLIEAHQRMLDVVWEYQREALSRLTRESDDPWRGFPCNSCLRHFGKPHWTSDGTSGKAARERWRGAWSFYSDEPSDRVRLRVLD